MNGRNGTCDDHDLTCGRVNIVPLSETFPATSTPPMCDNNSDPPDDPDPTYSTTQCQPCPCTEMEHSTTPHSPTPTTDNPTTQHSNVPTTSEPKSNTSSSQMSKVINERDSLRATVISLGVLVGILVVLLVVVTSGWVWTCWTMKSSKQSYYS